MSRVYNTGNYTNVSYSITAEVPKGASAKGTLFELCHTMQLLKPIKRPDCLDRLERVRKKPAEEQSAYEKENLPEWMEQAEVYARRLADRQAALESLDDLGGAMEKRDAKTSWDDDDTYF